MICPPYMNIDTLRKESKYSMKDSLGLLIKGCSHLSSSLNLPHP